MTDIKTLNNRFRRSFIGGKVMLTAGINNKSTDEVAEILTKVRTFDNFTEDNDPYGERDFGSFDYKCERIYWKIDYYDKSMRFASNNPANQNETTRVLTIMLADEY